MRTVLSLTSAGALLWTSYQSPVAMSSPSVAAVLDAINSLDSALRDQEVSLKSDQDVPVAFLSVDAIRRYAVGGLSQAVRYSLSLDGQLCAEPWLNKLQSDLLVIGEYFSVSNDAAQKMMVGDAYAGQKLNFVKQGLAASRADLREVSRCVLR